MIFRGKTGKDYESIEPAIGKGGEGSVYRIKGMPTYVLKVFFDKNRTESRHKKLLAMIASSMPQSALQQVTWPVDVVYQNGQFVGYIMPAVSNNEDLNVMYSDKYSCTLSERITIAMNLCSAINSVHNAGQVCGDLNPKNISVDPQHALVTLVDTDSYHITETNGNRVYRCEVGLPEYLPREIQEKMKNGQTLANAPLPTFTKYTDLFALAVHIFALLMNGCHPFACAVNNNVNIAQLTASQPSVAAPQPIDNICNGFFPFYTKKTGITTPIYAPEFNSLPQNIRDLFVRAFVDEHNNPQRRPDTVEWYNALSSMQGNLQLCRNNNRHMYSKHLNICPWCDIENKMKMISMPQLKQTSINTNQYYATNKNNIQQGIATNNTNNTPPKSSLGKWIGIVVGAIILISLFRSCASTNDDKYDNSYSNSYNTNDSQSSYETENKSDYYEEPTGPSYTKVTGTEFSGKVTSSTTDLYEYTATVSGKYRFDFETSDSSKQFSFELYDTAGNCLKDTGSYNDGTTVELVENHTYYIEIDARDDMVNYTVTIGVPKEGSVIDSDIISSIITYEDQEDMYTYVAPKTGRYYFEFDINDVNCSYSFDMYDSKNNTIADTGSWNDGKRLDLEEGETYIIRVKQYDGYPEYTINIGVPNDIAEIQGNEIRGTLSYTDQKDVYSFTAPKTGRYYFEFDISDVNCSYSFDMYDSKNSTIADTGSWNDGKRLDLEAGNTYSIEVSQYNGNAEYMIYIGIPKDPETVTNNAIAGTISYTDQRDVYYYTAPATDRFIISMVVSDAGCSYSLDMYDSRNATIADTGSWNDEKKVDLTAGETYTIYISQYNGYPTYQIYFTMQ